MDGTDAFRRFRCVFDKHRIVLSLCPAVGKFRSAKRLEKNRHAVVLNFDKFHFERDFAGRKKILVILRRVTRFEFGLRGVGFVEICGRSGVKIGGPRLALPFGCVRIRLTVDKRKVAILFSVVKTNATVAVIADRHKFRVVFRRGK